MAKADTKPAGSARAVSAESAYLQKAIETVKPRINQILLDCKDKPAGFTEPAVDYIVGMCIDAHLAYRRHIFGRNCGIHPDSGIDLFKAEHFLAGLLSEQVRYPNGFRTGWYRNGCISQAVESAADV